MVLNGAAVKVIRELSGYTQVMLVDLVRAEGTSFSQGRLSDIEVAATISVRPPTATALAAALNVPLGAILGTRVDVSRPLTPNLAASA